MLMILLQQELQEDRISCKVYGDIYLFLPLFLSDDGLHTYRRQTPHL